MADFTVRSEAVDVDEIMKQVRSRIREKRGVDYTEADLQHLANIKMEQFLDPRKLRSDLVEQFKRQRTASPAPHSQEGGPRVETGGPLKRFMKRLIRRAVMTAVNPQEIVEVMNAEFRRREELYYEILHNLVIELTRLGIEVHNLKMHVESVSSRIDFDERRGRALEGVVQYRPQSAPPAAPSAPPPSSMPSAQSTGNMPIVSGGFGAPSPAGAPGMNTRPDGEQQRRRRRRRRRRRPGQNMGDRPQGAPGAPGVSPGTQGAAASPMAENGPAHDDYDDGGGDGDAGGGEGDGDADQ